MTDEHRTLTEWVKDSARLRITPIDSWILSAFGGDTSVRSFIETNEGEDNGKFHALDLYAVTDEHLLRFRVERMDFDNQQKGREVRLRMRSWIYPLSQVVSVSSEETWLKDADFATKDVDLTTWTIAFAPSSGLDEIILKAQEEHIVREYRTFIHALQYRIGGPVGRTNYICSAPFLVFDAAFVAAVCAKSTVWPCWLSTVLLMMNTYDIR